MNGLGSKSLAWVHLTEREEGRVREKDTEKEEEALRRLRVRGMEFGVKLWFGSGHSLMVVVVMECCVVGATEEECSCAIFFCLPSLPFPSLSVCCLLFIFGSIFLSHSTK